MNDDSEHAKLSAKLAQALGWKIAPSYRVEFGVPVIDPAFPKGDFRWFDYRDPSVALPLIEWLMKTQDVQPVYAAYRNPFYKQYAMLRPGNDKTEQIDAWGNTIREAAAKAAIAVLKGRNNGK